MVDLLFLELTSRVSNMGGCLVVHRTWAGTAKKIKMTITTERDIDMIDASRRLCESL